MASAVIKFSAVLLLVAVCSAETDVFPLDKPGDPVTHAFLRCLCQAVTGCDTSPKCYGDRCGPFHLTWAYWADGGKPVLPGDRPDQPEAFRNCAFHIGCAGAAIRGYMSKYRQDCNGDGKIDEHDFLAIHKLGGYGCKGDLPYKFVNDYEKCKPEILHIYN